MSISLRNYGYSTKTEINGRIESIERAVKEYGVQSVYERLVKLGQFNPVMNEDAESVARIYELKAEEPKTTWKAMKPEVDKGVRLSKSCKNAPKMVTELGVYGVQDNAHSRLQLLQDLADKHGLFAVLSMMATHLVSIEHPDQKKIMEGDMEALKVSHNERMKAEAEEEEASVDAEASVEASVDAEAVAEAVAGAKVEVIKKKTEEKVLFLEMLDTKLDNYKRQLSNLLDNEDLDNNCILAFKSLRQNMVAYYYAVILYY